MCSRLNQFATFPALSLALRMMRIERRKKKKDEDRKAGVEVINNICPTDYADVLVMEKCEVGIERMRFGLVPSWAKGNKTEVAKKFALTFNARCETIFDLASYRLYGLNTFRYPFVQITGEVKPFDNKAGYTLEVLHVQQPRMKTAPARHE
ncbi:MAG: SOS response-associated peptidase family protein [Verrucomicrobiaceae bacterium]